MDAREMGELAVVGEVGPAVARLVEEDRDPAVRRHLVDDIADDAADQEVARLAALAPDPDRPVGEAEPRGHGLQPGAGRDQGVQRRIGPGDPEGLRRRAGRRGLRGRGGKAQPGGQQGRGERGDHPMAGARRIRRRSWPKFAMTAPGFH